MTVQWSHRRGPLNIQFGRYAIRDRGFKGLGKPETFAFLGFTHICGRNRNGNFLILRHTVGGRFIPTLDWTSSPSMVDARRQVIFHFRE